MQDLSYVISHFFTHKDFLVPASQIPGTLYTPLHILFEAILLAVIFSGAVWLSSRRERIRPFLTGLWVVLLIWEAAIVCWDSMAGMTVGLDLVEGLSLYPCSIFLYSLPFALWGRGLARQIACGYICTLGMLGAVVNFLYPISRLTDYSCISFPGFHTFFFHGSMLFTFLVMMLSGYHSYGCARRPLDLLLPCVASLIVSVPANIINYSPIDADYMYFKGRFFLLAKLFGDTPAPLITLCLYGLYILIPALFYLPGYLSYQRSRRAVYRQDFFLPDFEYGLLTQ